MKQPKRLSRKHKVILSSATMNPNDFMLSSEDADGFCVVHKDDHSKEYIFEYTGRNSARLVYDPSIQD